MELPVLTPLDEIPVPAPKPPQTYSMELLGRSFRFEGLKRVLGAADISKAGDRVAGLAAPDEVTREAARAILAGLTLQHLYDHPLTTQDGRVDEVMRVNYQIDLAAFAEISGWTLGTLRDRMLAATSSDLRRWGSGMTGVMAAALVKLLDVHEMVLIAKRLKHGASGKARTRVGLPGTLSSRLQPNHPTDHPDGIAALVYTGLSMGSGDAIIGLNPAVDTVETIGGLLHHLDRLRRETGAPTQICVLSHMKTQLACLERGAPVEILFQSLAGTERTLTEEFDVTVALLDQGCRTMAEKGPLHDIAENALYFETGQGSELTYGKHEGMDMTTTEALCYGLARRYRPFMVNNVTGFIGPETHLDNFEMMYANLQDHLMGKLLGLPMGMAPCYTLHAQVTREGQQIATELLTAAGANFFMDVYLANDRMLAYFDTSGHDDQTLREIHDLSPAPEYLDWAIERGIFTKDQDGVVRRGANWGNPRIFCPADAEWQRLCEATPAAYGFDNAGPRPVEQVARTIRANQAVAREAIKADLNLDVLGPQPWRVVTTRAADKAAHLGDPELGAQLSAADREKLTAESCPVQILIADGLSAEAVHHNIPQLVPVLLDGLSAAGIACGAPLVARHGRVKLAEPVAEALDAKLVILLIGERPGGDALASRSLSAYLAFRIVDPANRAAAAAFSGNADIRFEWTVISNIYSGGLPPIEAGSVIVEKARDILRIGAAGNRLEWLLGQRAAE